MNFLLRRIPLFVFTNRQGDQIYIGLLGLCIHFIFPYLDILI